MCIIIFVLPEYFNEHILALWEESHKDVAICIDSNIASVIVKNKKRVFHDERLVWREHATPEMLAGVMPILAILKIHPYLDVEQFL